MIPLAFSKYSQDILAYGADLATIMKCDLLVVNVINQRDVETVQRISSYGYDVDEAHYIQEIQSQGILALENMLEKIDFPEDRVRLVFKVGKPAEVLLALSVSEEVDLIVMGTKGQSELMHGFTGSVAEKLFRRSPVTIVSYRSGKPLERFKKELDGAGSG